MAPDGRWETIINHTFFPALGNRRAHFRSVCLLGTLSLSPSLSLSALPRLWREVCGLMSGMLLGLCMQQCNRFKLEFEVRLRFDLSQLNATLRAIILGWAT